ncbi:FkbM family methyltransferase [Candidatus Peregrinibacteria bacterium]|nr:MAG: FkbM family methyltransferase [Candidatus Peregrinibacteria bacterium]
MRSISFLKQKFQVEVSSDADESVLAEVFSLREYAWIEPALKTAKTVVLDIGAHKGYFTLYVRALNAEVPLWAYEPEEANFSALKKHLAMNKIHGVVAKNAAVAEHEGTLFLNVSEDSHNHSIVVAPGTCRQKKVSATTLEKIVNKFKKVEVLKMDIEGAEFQIFETAPVALFDKLETVFLEYHEYGPSMQVKRLQTLFERQGFGVKKIPSKYDKRMGFLWAKR